MAEIYTETIYVTQGDQFENLELWRDTNPKLDNDEWIGDSSPEAFEDIFPDWELELDEFTKRSYTITITENASEPVRPPELFGLWSPSLQRWQTDLASGALRLFYDKKGANSFKNQLVDGDWIVVPWEDAAIRYPMNEGTEIVKQNGSYRVKNGADLYLIRCKINPGKYTWSSSMTNGSYDTRLDAWKAYQEHING